MGRRIWLLVSRAAPLSRDGMGGLLLAVIFAGYLRETALMRIQLQNSEKLTLISELAASVAHEVRNPLTVVRGFVQLLRDGVDKERKEYIKLVLAELDRAEFIISDYLNLARPQDEMIETFDAAEMMREIKQVMFSYALMNRVQLKAHLEEGALYTRGDKLKCKQALMNLIKNGIEAMPGGGTIVLSAERIAQQVMLRITDTGQGMSPAQLKQMGQPFFTTKEKGTGLGLLVSIRIVEAMGGTIHFASELGKGTEVTVMLPLHMQSE
ncbi:ATP-binding protein [Brevibacillus migulae]|uniref:ATP-binding protein n=1 Tax=Brevibacillus migulae TaxID=1644114 RepID=UPI001431003D|nr:ATP-binding protein [Brevibacillus migulae]